MLNQKPRQTDKYKQGLYIPVNKEKLIKANTEGGVYYRSGLEKKMMIYLDQNSRILRWSAEYIRVPYKKTEWNANLKDFETTEHTYYPDFYYELQRQDGSTSRVVAEVKPYSETIEPTIKENMTGKQMKNLEYALKMYNKNLQKWKYMIEYCERKGFEFIIITEKNLGK